MGKRWWMLAAAAGLGLGGGTAGAQPVDPAKVEVRIESVRGGVHLLRGAGGNIGVFAGAEGLFLVDDQYAPLTPKILAALKALDPRPPRFVLNTHWHGDHSGGNENMGAAGALIVAHDNVRMRMSAERFLSFFNEKVPPARPGALPVVTYDRAVTFHIGGEEVHAFHVPPAHTDGDSVVHFRKADVIHAGDLFFNGIYPYIDVNNGGSIDGVIAAVERLLALAGPETRLIPGHGPLATREDLLAYRDMLEGVRRAVQALVAGGKTLEEAKAARPTSAYDARWGGGFLKPEDFTSIVFDSLTRARPR